MKEKIILAPGVSESELLRTLAKFGHNTLGMRVVSPIELAKIALIKSGISITEGFVSNKEEPSVIYSFLNNIPYFEAASYSDAESIASMLKTLRNLIPENEAAELRECLSHGEFQDKNDAIYEVYLKYIEILIKEKELDSISLIRTAIEKEISFDADFITLKEYQLLPLEQELLRSVSNGDYQEISLAKLFDREESGLSNIAFTKAYGEINEALSILSNVLTYKTSFDKCTIACTNSSYSQIFYELSKQYDIPMTFGSGIAITNSNPGKLLKLVYEWDTTGYNGIDALKTIFLSESFSRSNLKEILGLEEFDRRQLDDLIKMVGSLRLSFDALENMRKLSNYRPVLEKALENAQTTNIQKEIKKANRALACFDMASKFSEELGQGLIHFIEKFSVMRAEPEGRVDQSAINVISETINAYLKFGEGDVNEIIPQLLLKSVCSEISKEGYIHITSVKGALASIRANLFICGLSAAEFPGSPKENYLMLDSDLEKFGASSPTSRVRINQRKDELDNLLKLAAALEVNTNLSYSGYNLSDLKEKNPSSVLFTYYETLHPGETAEDFKNNVNKVGYFENNIEKLRLLGKSYMNDEDIVANPTYEEIEDGTGLLDKAWSPSALSVFFQCPRRFYLQNVQHIEEEETDDPFEVINAAEFGTLAHSLMEAKANKMIDLLDFRTMAGAAFDEFLLSRPPMHHGDAELKKEEFVDMMERAYKADPNNEVISAESEYTFTHPSGVTLHGYPDRVEKEPDGACIIADFKTMRNIEHVENDIDTCLQVIIYAWLCEQDGIDISRCDYRYLRKGKTVSCKYDAEIRDKLNDKLLIFKKAVDDNVFPRNPEKDNCKYCTMQNICDWENVILTKIEKPKEESEVEE